MTMFNVKFMDAGEEIQVEAEDRWGAIAKAVKELGLDKKAPVGVWAASSKVTKVERKKRLSWWEREK